MRASSAASCALAALLLTACPSPRPAPTRESPTREAAKPEPAGAGSVSASLMPSGAQNSSERVRLVAKHPLGVPLHPGEREPRVSARLPDATVVTVVARSADGRWLEIVAKDGTRGWITTRYAPTLRVEPTRTPVKLALDSEFQSREACEKLVSKRRASRVEGRARIASYNVRRFPDGDRGEKTDVEWLACVLASSNADVVLVQEFKNRKQSEGALDRLLERLDSLTQGEWQARLDDCPGAMHVGVLYDASRVQASSLGTFASLNPHGQACKDQLRPGFGGYFRFPGGFDAHLVSVHLKSAPTRRALQLRRKSLLGLGAAVAQARAARKDDDVVFAGDWNSMGCSKCSPTLDSNAEIARLDELLGQTTPTLRRVLAPAGCTHYFRGAGTLLDHFVVTAALRELPLEATATVSGYCGELACKPLGQREEPSAYRRLSDHCPVVVDFADRDLD